jgi:hypothetical protein
LEKKDQEIEKLKKVISQWEVSRWMDTVLGFGWSMSRRQNSAIWHLQVV